MISRFRMGALYARQFQAPKPQVPRRSIDYIATTEVHRHLEKRKDDLTVEKLAARVQMKAASKRQGRAG